MNVAPLLGELAEVQDAGDKLIGFIKPELAGWPRMRWEDRQNLNATAP